MVPLQANRTYLLRHWDQIRIRVWVLSFAEEGKGREGKGLGHLEIRSHYQTMDLQFPKSPSQQSIQARWWRRHLRWGRCATSGEGWPLIYTCSLVTNSSSSSKISGARWPAPKKFIEIELCQTGPYIQPHLHMADSDSRAGEDIKLQSNNKENSSITSKILSKSLVVSTCTKPWKHLHSMTFLHFSY